MANIGSSIASQLPEKPGTARENAILDLVRSGNVVVQWVPLTVDVGGVRATFQVTAEPLMLGSSSADGFYPGVTASTLQQIADFYDATLLTPKLVDEIWRQAQVRVDPFVGMVNSDESRRMMSDTAFFVRHTDTIRKKIPSGVGSGKLVANIGKYWVVSASTSQRLGLRVAPGVPAAENYGFFATASGVVRSVTGMPGVNVIQTPGHGHNYHHSDYSQVVVLVKRAVTVCDATGGCSLMDIYDLANNPALARLVSHEGTINMRLPGVAYVGNRPPPEPGLIGRGAGGRESPPGAKTPVTAPPVTTPPKISKQPSDVSLPTGGVPRRTKPGEKGAGVVAWQQFLISQGFDLKPYGADGGHGQTTEQASLDWERKLTPKISKQPTGVVPRRTKLGENGADVVAWQQFLISQGFDLKSYGADGDHGQTTEQASLEWERRPGKVNTASAASLFGSQGGMPNTGLAFVVAAAGAGVGWLAWDMMMSMPEQTER